MKYIIAMNEDLEIEFPVLFPDAIQHADVTVERSTVVSAGFFDGISCWGQSVSLGLCSRPEDTKIVRQDIGN